MLADAISATKHILTKDYDVDHIIIFRQYYAKMLNIKHARDIWRGQRAYLFKCQQS